MDPRILTPRNIRCAGTPFRGDDGLTFPASPEPRLGPRDEGLTGKSPRAVIPAEAGIHLRRLAYGLSMDPRFRGDDGLTFHASLEPRPWRRDGDLT
jgi:hypothetical protein